MNVQALNNIHLVREVMPEEHYNIAPVAVDRVLFHLSQASILHRKAVVCKATTQAKRAATKAVTAQTQAEVGGGIVLLISSNNIILYYLMYYIYS